MNDFETGFIIHEKSRSRYKLPYFEVNEQKETITCPYCHMTKIRKQSQQYEQRWVYAVIDGQFAYCKLRRWRYYCYNCDDFFYNTEEQNAYGRRNNFTRNFVKKALDEWLKDKPGEDIPKLSTVARRIGVSQANMSRWNSCLCESVPEIIPIIDKPVVFASFTDSERKRRGIICKWENNTFTILAFIGNYSSEWIRCYLTRNRELLSNIYKDDTFASSEVYFDYAPGLGKCLKEFFPSARIGINLHNLYSQICKRLGNMSQDEVFVFSNELNKLFFSTDVNEDTYYLFTIPEKLSAMIKVIPDGSGYFSDLAKAWAYDAFISNFYYISLAKHNMSGIRNKIKRMVGNHNTYETIQIKLLYDNADYRDAIKEGVDIAANTYGRKFDFMLSWEQKVVSDVQ